MATVEEMVTISEIQKVGIGDRRVVGNVFELKGFAWEAFGVKCMPSYDFHVDIMSSKNKSIVESLCRWIRESGKLTQKDKNWLFEVARTYVIRQETFNKAQKEILDKRRDFPS